MTEEAQNNKVILEQAKNALSNKITGVIFGFARGALYAFCIIFFSRLLSFSVEKIEIIFPLSSDDPYYDSLKKGLSFMGSLGSLLWFFAYTVKDLFIDFFYEISTRRRKEDAIQK